MEPITELFGKRDDLSQVLLIGTLIVSRILPIVFMTPFLGGKLVPPETRMSIGFGMALLVYSFASNAMQGTLDVLNPLVYITLLLKELFIGFAIGFVAVELYYAMEVAGRALDIFRGSNMTEVQVPELGFRASPLGDFAFHLLIVIFFGLGGHKVFLEAVFESFRLIPIDQFPRMAGGFAEFTDQVLRYTASLFGIAFALVFPGLFATFMTDIVFGMLNRVAPQLNAYFMAMAVKPLLGVLFFVFSLQLALEQLGIRVEENLLLIKRLIAIMQ